MIVSDFIFGVADLFISVLNLIIYILSVIFLGYIIASLVNREKKYWYISLSGFAILVTLLILAIAQIFGWMWLRLVLLLFALILVPSLSLGVMIKARVVGIGQSRVLMKSKCFWLYHLLVSSLCLVAAAIPMSNNNTSWEQFDNNGYYFNYSRGLPLEMSGYAGIGNQTPDMSLSFPVPGEAWRRIVYLPHLFLNLTFFMIVMLPINLSTYLYFHKHTRLWIVWNLLALLNLIIVIIVWLNWN